MYHLMRGEGTLTEHGNYFLMRIPEDPQRWNWLPSKDSPEAGAADEARLMGALALETAPDLVFINAISSVTSGLALFVCGYEKNTSMDLFYSNGRDPHRIHVQFDRYY
uniref:Uncharacterized protein n=1 Tax=Sphaerodactylus townsendi TaxID=933632 RepID=A0ACB8ED85_9SAUR